MLLLFGKGHKYIKVLIYFNQVEKSHKFFSGGSDD